MRTLNRPMFNWGGPVKEGVMHGIREPYRGGQLVQPGLGRPGYKGPPKSKLGIAGWLASKVPFLKQPVKKISKSTKDVIPKTWEKIKNVYKSDTKAKDYVPPGALTNRWYWERGIKPTGALIGAAGKKALPYAGTAGITGGLIAGFWPDGTPKNTTELIDDNVVVKDYGPHTKKKLPISQEQRDAKAKADKEKRINELLDTMGYDKARKNAAYDALIDAGSIISQRGTLDPKNIGTELVDPIVAATSKRFDKPQDIREAVGLLMTKGEIEKDIAAGKGSALKQQAADLVSAGVFKTQEKALEHLAKVPSISEKAVTYAGTMKKTGIDQEVVIMTMDDQYGQRPTVLLSEDDMEELQKGDDYKDDLTVFETLKKNPKKGIGPGYYVIGASGFVVDSNGRTRQVL